MIFCTNLPGSPGSGLRGLVRVPHEEDECRRVLGAYERFIGKREALLRRLIEERSADEDLQKMIYNALSALLINSRVVVLKAVSREKG